MKEINLNVHKFVKQMDGGGSKQNKVNSSEVQNLDSNVQSVSKYGGVNCNQIEGLNFANSNSIEEFAKPPVQFSSESTASGVNSASLNELYNEHVQNSVTKYGGVCMGQISSHENTELLEVLEDVVNNTLDISDLPSKNLEKGLKDTLNLKPKN